MVLSIWTSSLIQNKPSAHFHINECYNLGWPEGVMVSIQQNV